MLPPLLSPAPAALLILPAMTEHEEWKPDRSNPVDLGIWDELGWTQPPPEKKAKTKCLKLKKKVAAGGNNAENGENSRFVSPEKDLETYQQPYCPKNTAVSTRWALKNFEDWASTYNVRHPESPCPEGVLLVDDPKLLSFWL